jgi:hypothetical protein
MTSRRHGSFWWQTPNREEENDHTSMNATECLDLSGEGLRVTDEAHSPTVALQLRVRFDPSE